MLCECSDNTAPGLGAAVLEDAASDPDALEANIRLQDDQEDARRAAEAIGNQGNSTPTKWAEHRTEFGLGGDPCAFDAAILPSGLEMLRRLPLQMRQVMAQIVDHIAQIGSPTSSEPILTTSDYFRLRYFGYRILYAMIPKRNDVLIVGLWRERDA
jgi:mRNA-degrading endonuclease RelE of RelBE toxin-antitoxin system